MKDIRISKLVVNICVGESGDRLTRAARVLKDLTEELVGEAQEPCYGVARLTVRTFSIRRNEKISTYVSVRGPPAEALLNKALAVKEFELNARNFGTSGNFGFGLEEHIDLGLKYDPSVGIYGMDFFVCLDRPGYRVASRKRGRSRIGKNHRVTRDDAMKWFKTKFAGTISTARKDEE
jgi:large subunit ribosomal protein L11e